ncbi:hypothetical protein HZA97_07845 [Candidatus Woesearchaeota archaeon]|nr:hypothetical protein [Candidatus Woesearchaeota archaeon]
MTYLIKGELSLESTLDSCDTEELIIEEKKLFMPKEGWESYLTRKYSNWNNEYTAIGGEIIIWKQKRIPLPWLYCYAQGEAVGYFVASDGVIYQPRTVKFDGKITTLGLAIELGFVNFRKIHSEKNTRKQTFKIGSQEVNVVESKEDTKDRNFTFKI